ncbi:MAG: DUF4065 domain-containing protein [Cenarchaeum sp. SB0665_bin_23]|nr:DUF4065 domain-containing protein [Cenarchaeum sp. SB0665_bin_23]MYG33348.1 DUF4065 domain-containing protein [Cenarchaeum sp. SB0677_bin_16]
MKDGISSLLVSDYIVNKYNGKFTPFHLIKLVFISHGRTLAALKKPLIWDRIEAWRYGPVIPVLYHELKLWGNAPVQNLHYCGTKPDDEDRRLFFETVLPEKERYLIDLTVNDYGDWSFWDLRKLCHEPGSPWDTHYDEKFGTEIPDSTIQEYYVNEMV